MITGTGHLSGERLAALALSPAGTDDAAAAAHARACASCGDALARLTLDLDTLRDEAAAECDRLFDDALLKRQRTRVLDRLAHLGQSARVIAFPRRPVPSVLSSRGPSRRWIGMAAAAGLVLGLLAGELVQLFPAARPAGIVLESSQTASARDTGFVRASAALSEDELLDEIDLSVQQGRCAAELRALNALTPTLAESSTLMAPPR